MLLKGRFCFTLNLRNVHLLRSGHRTIASYLNRVLRSASIHRKTVEIILSAQCHLYYLRAGHIPGFLNTTVDLLFREPY